jgi:putative peptidoglycan lipid II flippase
MTKNVKKSGGLFKSAMVMSAATSLSRMLGLVREQTIAYFFGVSGLTDTFNVAYRIPNLLRDLLAEGSFSSAFVPSFTQALQKNINEAKELFRASFWFLFLLTLFFTVVFFVMSPSLITLFAPEYANDPEKMHLTVVMLKIMSPFVVLTTLAAIIMGVLNTHKFFFIPALAPASFNLLSISTIWLLTDYLDANGYQTIYSLAWGVLLGGIVQMGIQIPLLLKQGFDFNFPKVFFPHSLRQILRRLAPGLVGYSTSQINILINTILATSAAVGSITWLSFGFRLFSFPLGILSVSLGSSTLVHFSGYWKSDKKNEAINLLGRSYYFAWLIVAVPFIFIAVFPDWLVHLVYERGKFTAHDTAETAQALFWYGMGLPFYGLFKNLMPIFYSIDRAKIPMYTGVLSLLVNISYSMAFIGDLGHPALAQATSLSMFSNVVMMMFFLTRYLNLGWKFFIPMKIIKLWASVALLIYPMMLFAQEVNFYLLSTWNKLFILGFLAFALYIFLDVLLILSGSESFALSRLWKKFFKA